MTILPVIPTKECQVEMIIDQTKKAALKVELYIVKKWRFVKLKI